MTTDDPLNHLRAMSADLILTLLTNMDSDSRKELFGTIRERYCEHCGIDQPLFGYCQCNNDE